MSYVKQTGQWNVKNNLYFLIWSIVFSFFRYLQWQCNFKKLGLYCILFKWTMMRRLSLLLRFCTSQCSTNKNSKYYKTLSYYNKFCVLYKIFIILITYQGALILTQIKWRTDLNVVWLMPSETTACCTLQLTIGK